MINQINKTTVVGLFNNTEDMNKAIEVLKNNGLEESQISLMAREPAPTLAISADYISVKEEVTFGKLAGATTGATVGIFAGTLIGLSAIAVPGVGPVLSAGAIATILGSAAAGTGVGAIAGSLLVGGLAKMGLPEKKAHLYAEGVKRGGLLLAVQTDEAHVEEVEKVLGNAKAADMNILQQT